jgi:hypothetical protein
MCQLHFLLLNLRKTNLQQISFYLLSNEFHFGCESKPTGDAVNSLVDQAAIFHIPGALCPAILYIQLQVYPIGQRLDIPGLLQSGLDLQQVAWFCHEGKYHSRRRIDMD